MNAVLLTLGVYNPRLRGLNLSRKRKRIIDILGLEREGISLVRSKADLVVASKLCICAVQTDDVYLVPISEINHRVGTRKGSPINYLYKGEVYSTNWSQAIGKHDLGCLTQWHGSNIDHS